MADLLAYVDPLQGTDSTKSFSHGNTLPIVSTPFAMNSWVLETTGDPSARSNWFYSPHHRSTLGIRCSHQPSPWIGDYMCFRVTAQTGARDFSKAGMISSFSPERARIAPDGMSLSLHRFGTELSLSPAARGALVEARFPVGARERRLIVNLVYGSLEAQLLPDARTVILEIATPSDGCRDDLRFFVAIRTSAPVTEIVRFGEPSAHGKTTGTNGAMPTVPAGVALDLSADPEAGNKPVTAWIATSYVGRDQALTTLERELAPLDLAAARASAAAAWNERLRRFEASTTDERRLKTFYSCLYRTQLYPSFTHEIDASGNTVHRSFYDGAVHPGPMVTNNGFWDTYRTVYPLLSIAYPETLATILDAWVAASREAGWTPKWPAPGHRGVMIGTHLDAVFADAYCKRIEGWDAGEAYRIARRNAFEIAPPGAPYGRVGLREYLELGYVPEDKIEHAASRTMDFAYGDFCLSVMAKEYDDAASYEALRERAAWYRNIFDPGVGFLRGRNADGSFSAEFDPFRWGGPYVEGSAWQCGLAVYHDPAGLAELIAGASGRSSADALEAHLDAVMNAPPVFDAGHYSGEIHEMSEMAAVEFGQYAHSNQPSHHIPFLYAYTRSPWKMDHVVRSVLDQLYDFSARGFCGDEDNGEMSSWYVLASMGLYQICPGKPEFVLTSPLFEELTLTPEMRAPTRFLAPGNSSNSRFLARVTRDGREIAGRFVSYDELVRAKELRFDLQRVPHA